MRALLQVFVFYAVLFFVFRLFRLKDFLLTAAIVSLAFRTDYGLVEAPPMGGWADGIAITISDVCMLCVGLRLLFQGQLRADFSSGVFRAMVAFVVACALSMLNTRSQPSTFFQVVMLVQVLLLYYVIFVNGISNPEDLDVAVRATAISMLFQGALGCIQVASGKDFSLFATGSGESGIIYAGNDMMRAVGTRSGRPNAYAMVVASLFLFNLGVLRSYPVSKVLRFGALAVGFFGTWYSVVQPSLLLVRRYKASISVDINKITTA